MRKQLLAILACGALGGLIAYVSLSKGPTEVATTKANARDDSGELQALRKDVAALRAEVKNLRQATTNVSRAEIDQGAARRQAERADDTPPELPPEAPAGLPQGAEQYEEQRRVAVVEADRRFTMLAIELRTQPRNVSWARQKEQELSAIPASHDYFKGTKMPEVECRSTWCRVLAEHADDWYQGTFEETFTNFAPGFGNASMRPVEGANPPRTEVFLSSAGPLPQ